MQTWKYCNNRTVHFNQTPTEGTNSTLNSEEEESGSEEENSEPDKDTAQVEDLLRRAKTTVTSAIQKLSSHPGTPSPTNLPLPKTSLLPGKFQLSTTEVHQVPILLVSKGKQPAPVPPPPRTQMSSSSSRPAQTSSIPFTTKSSAQPPLTRNPKGTAPPPAPSAPASTLKACPPPGGGPPNPPPTMLPMTTNQPRILGTAPEPFNRKGDNAIAFWNVLDNYFTVNATTFNTDEKKVASALTYFKQGTQAGDWASDCIANALAANPTDYGMWQAFKDAFKAQFIPLETQIEAIKKVHNTPQRNWEFNEWYQEWSKYARRANIDNATKMYAFCSALNTALHSKILQLSPMPTTLAGLVEKAREFDKNWCTFARPTHGFQCSRNNVCIQEISGEDSEINATMQRHTSFGCGRGRGHGHGRLFSEEREHCIKLNLCLYCAEPGHHAIECTTPPN